MPKEIHVPKQDNHSGVYIIWTKTCNRIDIGGWYDNVCGIEGRSFTLKEFLEELGITKKDILRALDAK